MPALSNAEINAMRDAIEADLLPDTCDILTVTETADGQGGVTKSWGTAYSNVAFRLDMKQGREMVAGGALQPFTMYTGSLPYDATITTADRILYEGGTYAVTSVNTNQSWNVVRRVVLEVV